MDLPIGSRRVAPFSLIQLGKLYQSGQFSDFTILVGSPPIELKVHRIVLAAASEYFAALFQVGTRESQEGRVSLTETNPILFRKLIESTYGLNSTFPNFKDQIDVIKMIKFYRFFTPMDRLRRYIVSMELPPDGIVDYISMIEYVYDELTCEMIDLIAKKIGPESQLADLSDEMLHCLFSSKQFPRSSFQDELQVVQFIHRLVLLDHTTDLYRYVKFLNVPPEERNKIAPELLDRYLERSVRFPLTFNLKDHLLERFETEEEIPLDPITVVVDEEYRLVSNSSIGAFVRGDGDQTPIQVLFCRTSPISKGDIIEILDYTLVSSRKTEIPFCVYAHRWSRL